MLGTTKLQNRLNVCLAADVPTLAAATAMNLHIIASAFTPSLTTDFTSMTEASFVGSTALSATAGAQTSYFDPIQQCNVCSVQPPLGGWLWQCTSEPSSPQVIFGYVLTDHANVNTWGSALFSSPVTIAHTGDAVQVDEVRFNLSQVAIS